MKRTYNKFLIISTIALAMGGSYLYFSNDLNSSNVIPVAYGSSLASSAQADAISSSPSPISDSKISSDISFLTTLVSLKKIKIDTSLFANQHFNQLQNNAVKIEKVTPGRTNPFSPISYVSTVTTNSTAKIVTDQPTQITSTSAVLNGTVNTGGATDIYFQYGTTPTFGSVTPIVKQSLVGTFIKSILGLTPKTNYLYRACAKVNGTLLCGDVVSFTTN